MANDDDGEEEVDSDAEAQPAAAKKRKANDSSAAPATATAKGKKAAGKKAGGDDEDSASQPVGTTIKLRQHVSLTFSLKYLMNFTKSTALTDTVMSVFPGRPLPIFLG